MKTSSGSDDVVRKRTWKYITVSKQEFPYIITLGGDWGATTAPHHPVTEMKLRNSPVLSSSDLVDSSFKQASKTSEPRNTFAPK